MRKLTEEEILLISGGMNVWKELLKPLLVIAAGAVAGPGGAASAVVALYGVDALHKTDAGDTWGELHLPSEQRVQEVMHNPYDYAD